MKTENIERPEVVFLKPETTKIFKGTFDMLHVMLSEGALFRGVFAVAAFPVSSPKKFISLFHYDEKDKIQEIGMIENIETFPEETRSLIMETLNKHYFSFEIAGISGIKFEYGLLFFAVETDKGPKKFSMRWESSRAVDFGSQGKILIDIFEDRYIIRNIASLSRIEQELFTRYIYW